MEYKPRTPLVVLWNCDIANNHGRRNQSDLTLNSFNESSASLNFSCHCEKQPRRHLESSSYNTTMQQPHWKLLPMILCSTEGGRILALPSLHLHFQLSRLWPGLYVSPQRLELEEQTSGAASVQALNKPRQPDTPAPQGEHCIKGPASTLQPGIGDTWQLLENTAAKVNVWHVAPKAQSGRFGSRGHSERQIVGASLPREKNCFREGLIKKSSMRHWRKNYCLN